MARPDVVAPPPPMPHTPGVACGDCHKAAFAQWSGSMHAQALLSPVMIAETNQVVRGPMADQADEAKRLCATCHSPVVATATKGATLPLTSNGTGDEGVGCTTCHQFNGDSVSGSGGLAAGFASKMDKSAMFANLSSPVANSRHGSASGKAFADPSQLCTNCHDVNFDRNGDGKIVKGVDLVLQTTAEESAKAVAAGDTRTCVSCHMPLMPSVTRAAENALIPDDQKTAAPDREVHDHSFIGVDYRLDLPAAKDPQRAARQKLLEGAAKLALEEVTPSAPTRVAFKASISNIGATHNLPTGLAFTRQMWLEVIVANKDGIVVLSSGVLADHLSDLCDNATLSEVGSPVVPYVQGCTSPDPLLVNFQTKLVDKIDILRDAAQQPVLNADNEFIAIQATDGHETVLQQLTGGAVARRRPSDNQAQNPIAPGETREFTYELDATGFDPQTLTVSVRLLFRNLPPYFLRALAARQPDGEVPRLYPLIPNLQTVSMGTATRSIVFTPP